MKGTDIAILGGVGVLAYMLLSNKKEETPGGTSSGGFGFDLSGLLSGLSLGGGNTPAFSGMGEADFVKSFQGLLDGLPKVNGDTISLPDFLQSKDAFGDWFKGSGLIPKGGDSSIFPDWLSTGKNLPDWLKALLGGGEAVIPNLLDLPNGGTGKAGNSIIEEFFKGVTDVVRAAGDATQDMGEGVKSAGEGVAIGVGSVGVTYLATKFLAPFASPAGRYFAKGIFGKTLALAVVLPNLVPTGSFGDIPSEQYTNQALSMNTGIFGLTQSKVYREERTSVEGNNVLEHPGVAKPKSLEGVKWSFVQEQAKNPNSEYGNRWRGGFQSE